MLKALLTSAAVGYYDYQWKVNLSVPFMIFYSILMVFSLFLTLFAIRIALALKAFHPNITRLYSAALSMWITLFISKSCLLLFQIRYDFATRDRNTEIDKESGGFLLLQIAAFFRYLYFFFGSATPLASTIERGFATFYLRTYEKSPHLPVFLAIFLTNLLLGLIFATLSVFHNLSLITVIITLFINILLCFIILNILYRYNTIRIRRLNRYHRDTQYTLSKRFQLKENIGILTLLMKMIYAVLIFIVFIVIGFAIPVIFGFGAQIWFNEVLRAITDFCFFCNPLLVIPATAYFIPEFRRAARSAIFQSVKLGSVASTNRSAVYHKRTNEADVYFDQFKKSITKSKNGFYRGQYPVAFVKRYT